jgi:hypothetical protein
LNIGGESSAASREKALAARKLAKDGVDPIADRQRIAASQRSASWPTKL